MREKITEVIWAFIIAFFFIALLMILTPADAAVQTYEDELVGFYTGDELKKACEGDRHTVQRATCLGYIAGVTDGALDNIKAAMTSKTMACEDPYSGTVDDIRKMVVWIIDTYPNASKPTADAEMVILHALGEVWKCTGIAPTPKQKT